MSGREKSQKVQREVSEVPIAANVKAKETVGIEVAEGKK
jgi:hypothetical protein